MTVATINRTPLEELDYVVCAAGLLKPGDVFRTVGGWDRVTSVKLAPDHAAVVIVATEGDKARRWHCDDRVRVIR